MKEIGTIFQEADYSKFKLISSNREIKDSSVKRMIRSIRQIGYRMVPIVINKQFEIIDGQTRFMACKQLGCPIKYIVDADADANICSLLNEFQRNWSMYDFLDSYAKQGIDAYVKLKKISDDNPDFKAPVIYAMAKGKIATSGEASAAIREQRIVLSAEECERAQRSCEFVREFRMQIDNIGGDERTRLTVFPWILGLKNVSEVRLRNIIKKNTGEFLPITARGLVPALSKISDIYNRAYSKKMYFDFEYKLK